MNAVLVLTVVIMTINDDTMAQDVNFTSERTPLYIGGFLNSAQWGFRAIDACVRHANEIPGILDGYELKLRWNLTKRYIPGLMLHLLHEYIYTPPTVVGIVGPMFSDLCLEINEVAASYGLNQVTVATSPSLKDRSRYPLTVQSYQDNAQLTPAKAAFVKSKGWKRVAMVNENIDVFLQTSKDLTLLLFKEGVSVVANEVLTDDNSEQIKSLLRHDARIFFLEMYTPTRAKFICQAYRLGLWGSKYVWVIPAYTQVDWWQNEIDNIPCTAEDMATFAASAHYIGFVAALKFNQDLSTVSFNGVKPADKHLSEISTQVTGVLAGLYYDSCIALVLAINASIHDLAALNISRSVEEFQYSDLEIGKIVHDHLVRVDFVGATEHVSFSDEGVRLTDISIRQLLEDKGWKHIMRYNTLSGRIAREPNKSFYWQKGFVPVDGITEIDQLVQVSRQSRVILYIFTCIGICLTLMFLAINIIYRNKRAIKISSPKLSTVILFGSITLYVSIFTFGQDTSNFSEKNLSTLCQVRLALLCLGFSVSFGTLFMKTYRIHAIFHKAVKKLKKINVSDSKMIMGVLIPVSIDVLIIAIMSVVTSPEISTHRLESHLDSRNTDAEIFIVPVVEFCTSPHQFYFAVVIYGVKAVLLTFGIFLAWENRNITVSELNDSKYIAMSIYIVAVTLVILIPSLNLVFYDVDLYFILLGIALVFINTTVLCLVFMPKVLLLWTSKGQDIRITMMSGSHSTLETTSGVAANKLHRKTKIDQLQEILLEKQKHLKETASKLNQCRLQTLNDEV